MCVHVCGCVHVLMFQFPGLVWWYVVRGPWVEKGRSTCQKQQPWLTGDRLHGKLQWYLVSFPFLFCSFSQNIFHHPQPLFCRWHSQHGGAVCCQAAAAGRGQSWLHRPKVWSDRTQRRGPNRMSRRQTVHLHSKAKIVQLGRGFGFGKAGVWEITNSVGVSFVLLSLGENIYIEIIFNQSSVIKELQPTWIMKWYEILKKEESTWIECAEATIHALCRTPNLPNKCVLVQLRD